MANIHLVTVRSTWVIFHDAEMIFVVVVVLFINNCRFFALWFLDFELAHSRVTQVTRGASKEIRKTSWTDSGTTFRVRNLGRDHRWTTDNIGLRHWLKHGRDHRWTTNQRSRRRSRDIINRIGARRNTRELERVLNSSALFAGMTALGDFGSVKRVEEL